SGLRRTRVRPILVAGEVGIALLLLIGAGLLIRTLIALQSVNPGFDPRNVVTTRTLFEPRLAKNVLEGLHGMPGVESTAYTRLLPLACAFISPPIIVGGRPLEGPSHGYGRLMTVSSGYFQVLRIPLIRGRGFADSDRAGTQGVAIINQTMAHQLWPGGDPLGAL